jgi:hypothetical protein
MNKKDEPLHPPISKPAPYLDQDHLLRLGECIHEMISRLGFGYQMPAEETLLFREATIEAIQILSSWQSMREWERRRTELSDAELPDVPHIRIEDLAQAIIDHGFDSPTPPYLRVRGGTYLGTFGLRVKQECMQKRNRIEERTSSQKWLFPGLQRGRRYSCQDKPTYQ